MKQATAAITNGVSQAETPAAFGRVLEVAGHLGTGDARHAVGQEDPAVVGADVLVAEEVGGGGGEQGEVAAEVEADDAGADDQSPVEPADLEEERAS